MELLDVVQSSKMVVSFDTKVRKLHKCHVRIQKSIRTYRRQFRRLYCSDSPNSYGKSVKVMQTLLVSLREQLQTERHMLQPLRGRVLATDAHFSKDPYKGIKEAEARFYNDRIDTLIQSITEVYDYEEVVLSPFLKQIEKYVSETSHNIFKNVEKYEQCRRSLINKARQLSSTEFSKCQQLLPPLDITLQSLTYTIQPVALIRVSLHDEDEDELPKSSYRNAGKDMTLEHVSDDSDCCDDSDCEK